MPNPYDQLDEQGLPFLVSGGSSQIPSPDAFLTDLVQNQPQSPQQAVAQVKPGQKVSQGQSRSGPVIDPFSLQSMYEEYKAKHAQEQADERANIAAQRQALQAYQDAQNNPLSAFLAYVDSSTGSKFGSAYNDQVNHQKSVADLQNAITQRQASLSREDANQLKSLIQARQSEQKMNALLAPRMANLALRTDMAAGQVGNLFDRDPSILEGSKRLQQIGIDSHTLEKTPVLSRSASAELARGIARALAGASAAGWHEVQMQIPSSAEGKLNEIASWIDANPRNTVSPEQRQYMTDMLKRLENSYYLMRERRAKEISAGRNYQLPELQQTMQNKVESLKAPEQKQPEGEVKEVTIGGVTQKYRKVPGGWEEI